MSPDDPRHGTQTGYTDGGCRNTCCRTAAARAWNTWQLRRIANGGQPLRMPSFGALRRIHALMAIGYPRRTLAIEAGYKGDAFAPLITGTGRPRIDLTTHQRIVDLYERLRDTPGPSARTRAHAARQGWAGPEGTTLTATVWRDATLDSPHARPATPRTRSTWRRADLVAEYQHLADAGLPLAQAAAQIGVTRSRLEKAIERHHATTAASTRQENTAA